jgi:hypothetical protein
MEEFVVTVSRRGSATYLEIYFEDDIAELTEEAADYMPHASYNGVVFYARTPGVYRVYATEFEFVDALHTEALNGTLFAAGKKPLTIGTPGYGEVYRAADSWPSIILK